jgi:small neutral amino acid transporter SnatA (MarC family)
MCLVQKYAKSFLISILFKRRGIMKKIFNIKHRNFAVAAIVVFIFAVEMICGNLQQNAKADEEGVN